MVTSQVMVFGPGNDDEIKQLMARCFLYKILFDQNAVTVRQTRLLVLTTDLCTMCP